MHAPPQKKRNNQRSYNVFSYVVDVVHAVVYSLLLLNTDLHVAQGDHKKMSRSAFVRNTMNAARAQYERTAEDDELLREEHRTSNVTFRSVDSHSYDMKRTPSCKSSASNGSLGRFYSTAASSLDMTPAAVIHGTHPPGSKGWQSEVEAILIVTIQQLIHPPPFFIHLVIPNLLSPYFRKCICLFEIAKSDIQPPRTMIYAKTTNLVIREDAVYKLLAVAWAHSNEVSAQSCGRLPAKA